MLSYAVFIATIGGPTRAWAQVPYPAASYPIPTSPAGDEGPLGATFNPAAWGVLQRPAVDFWWSDRSVVSGSLDNWGFAVGKRLGFSAARSDFASPSGPLHVTDYQLGLGGGSEGRYLGAAYGWSSGDAGALDRDDYLSLGTLHRPNRFLSLGATGRVALGGPARDALLSVAARPLGNPKLMLFADYAVERGEQWDEGTPIGGVAFRPWPGLDASLKWREQGELQVSLGLSFLHFGARATSDYADGDRQRTDYLVRLAPPLAGADLEGALSPRRRMLDMSLHGRAVYQRARYGEQGTIALRELTERIQKAQNDPTVAGLALNLSGFTANPAMVWEVREKLAGLRRQGKFVVVYADRLDLAGLYLASVADRIVFDPSGYVLIPGLQSSRTYLRDMLEKIGVGFDEWRFLEYKSAMETYSRDSMSAADKRQRQQLLDDFYAEMAQGITARGRMTRAALDSVMNERPMLLPPELLARGWVDRLGRWDDLRAEGEKIAGHRLKRMSSRTFARLRWRPEEEWGPAPVISLVYALGECAMDTGIRGRTLSRALHQMGDNRRVRGVVLRADSPGGDPLPCDLVAQEMLRLRSLKRTVLVSQGRVAASGGYWISMEGDSISASPFTITGSVGIIGGWFWNEGLGKKLGLTSDRVQVGKSADLLGGVTLPLLDLTIPERNLNAHERALVFETLRSEYEDFVSRVAKARDLDTAYVHRIAEGHAYSGRDAVTNRLVDRIATLDETIESAKRRAGLAPGRRVRVVEYPKAPLFRWPRLLPAWPSVGSEAPEERGPLTRALGRASYESLSLDMMLGMPGRPLALTPAALIPDERP